MRLQDDKCMDGKWLAGIKNKYIAHQIKFNI